MTLDELLEEDGFFESAKKIGDYNGFAVYEPKIKKKYEGVPIGMPRLIFGKDGNFFWYIDSPQSPIGDVCKGLGIDTENELPELDAEGALELIDYWLAKDDLTEEDRKTFEGHRRDFQEYLDKKGKTPAPEEGDE